MDKFAISEGFYYWNESMCVNPNEGIVWFNIDTMLPHKARECTREEFTAAALQAIEKLKAQGIDIGTEWLPKWEPKVGEFVCAWDNRNGEGFIVAKFVSKSDGIFPYTLSNNYAYQYIAPFTGEIPEPFKSRWEAEGDANQ
jgi:hypothetical protein